MAEPTLLIAHSDETAAKALRSALEQQGYAVPTVAQSSAEVVQRIRTDEIALALIDVHLGEMYAGFQVGQYVHNATAIPVVYVAVEPDETLAERIRENEAYGLITTPRNTGAVAAQVRIALDRHEREQGAWHRLGGLLRLLDAQPEAVVAINGEGRVTFMNAAAQTFAQQSMEEFGEHAVEECFPVDGAHPVTAVLQGQAAPEGPFALTTQAGTQSIETRSIAPVTRRDDSVAGAVWMFTEAGAASGASEEQAAERLRMLEELIAEMGLGDRLESLIQERKQQAPSGV
jgi:DNA-binding response OmpR family regulator